MSTRIRTSILIIIALIVGFVAGLYARNIIPIGPAPRTISSSTSTVSVMIDYENGTVDTYHAAPNDDLFDTIQKIAKANKLAFDYKNYSGLGALITMIGDKANGQNGAYWQYWVNNVPSSLGASSYMVKPGDIVEWKFLPYKGL